MTMWTEPAPILQLRCAYELSATATQLCLPESPRIEPPAAVEEVAQP